MAKASKKAPAKKRTPAKKTADKNTAAKKTATKQTAAKKNPAKKKTVSKKNKLGVENSLVNNINARKKKHIARPKKRSTVSKTSYKKMEENWD